MCDHEDERDTAIILCSHPAAANGRDNVIIHPADTDVAVIAISHFNPPQRFFAESMDFWICLTR